MDTLTKDIPPSMINLIGGFASNTPTQLLSFPHDQPATDVQDFLLHRILLNPHFCIYPPSVQYQALFWKWAIRNLEDILSNTTEACTVLS